MNFQPLQDRILVKRAAADEVSEGGIIIPDGAKEKPARGTVVATGRGRFVPETGFIDLEVKIGDEVLFSKYAGTEINVGEGEHVIIREDDILGFIRPEAA